MFDESNIIALMAAALALGLLPLIVVTTTAFLKIAIVLFLIRSALGTQQTPPNLVLYAVAIILTGYVSMPMLLEIAAAVEATQPDLSSIDGVLQIVSLAVDPLRAFLLRHTDPAERTFLLEAAATLWPPGRQVELDPDSLTILIPAFMISELSRGFEIGFLLYLPFIAIDLVISNVLMAMGMMMVSPQVVSIPFKLLLFVAIDGWARLTHGLILSYALQ